MVRSRRCARFPLVIVRPRQFSPTISRIERWQHEQRQQSRRDQSADHHCRQRLLNFGAGPMAKRHRHEAERRYKCRHRDGPEPGQGAVTARRHSIHAVAHQILDRSHHDQPVEDRDAG